MSETPETIIASLFRSLEIDSEHKISQAEADCCPICLDDIKNSDGICLFVCCGKSMCLSCFNHATSKSMSNCPMCRHVTPKSTNEIMELLQKNSNLGKAWAQHKLGSYYDSTDFDSTDPSTQTNDAEAVRLYSLSAKQGYVTAQNDLGMKYLFGHGCAKSMKQAIYWLTLAAYHGSISAKVILGTQILNGTIPSRSKEDGILLIGKDSTESLFASISNSHLQRCKKAALQNDSTAQFHLSCLLFSLKQEIPTAMYWLRKSAGSGHVEAIKLLQEQENSLASYCGACFKSLDGLGKKCTKCKSVYYCNKECQVNDWKRHRKECVDQNFLY